MSFALRAVSSGDRGRKTERRLKRTSLEVWRRPSVSRKMLCGEKNGNVEMRKSMAEAKRRFKAMEVLLESGRMESFREW